MYFPAAKRRRDRGCLHAQCALFVGDAMTALCSRSEARAPVDMISQVFCQGSPAQKSREEHTDHVAQKSKAAPLKLEQIEDLQTTNDKKPDVGIFLKCRHMQ